MELQLGVCGFLLTTHTVTHTNKMHPRSSYPVRRFTHVYLHAQTAVRMHLTNHNYFDRGKPEYPQLQPHAGIMMAQVLESQVYICALEVKEISYIFKAHSQISKKLSKISKLIFFFGSICSFLSRSTFPQRNQAEIISVQNMNNFHINSC